MCALPSRFRASVKEARRCEHVDHFYWSFSCARSKFNIKAYFYLIFFFFSMSFFFHGWESAGVNHSGHFPFYWAFPRLLLYYSRFISLRDRVLFLAPPPSLIFFFIYYYFRLPSVYCLDIKSPLFRDNLQQMMALLIWCFCLYIRFCLRYRWHLRCQSVTQTVTGTRYDDYTLKNQKNFNVYRVRSPFMQIFIFSSIQSDCCVVCINYI